ncbi:TIGR01244 family sulfur transferase [Primorskyibacter sp. S187A]|uniref:TIGR01244 family sulfur transferase n=1 Tax=Primorskyibacter sp. S187A TaxID=3415130 RepID=UPI003C7B7783
MTPRHIADAYHVSPQISLDDVARARDAGFRTIICNRPDEEIPADLHADAMQAAVEAEGMTFHRLPFNHMTLDRETVAAQRTLVETSEGPILAYCASGNRCTIVWALGQAETGARSPSELLALARTAGYDLSGMAATLEALSAQASSQ